MAGLCGQCKIRYLRNSQDFPGGPVVENPPSNAGGTGSIPGRRTKIPQTVQCSCKTNKQQTKNCRLGIVDSDCIIFLLYN